MLAVALLPLGAFTVLVVAGLGSVSRATVDETDRALLDNRTNTERRELDDVARALAVRIGTVNDQVRTLHDRAADVLRRVPSIAAPPVLAEVGGIGFTNVVDTTGAASTLLIATRALVHSAPPPPASPTAAAAAATTPAIDPLAASEAATAALAPVLTGVLSASPAIRDAWVADRDQGLVRVAPALDVPGAVGAHRIGQGLVNPDGGAAFSALAGHVADVAVEGPTWEGESAGTNGTDARPTFTGTYATGHTGEVGITAYQSVVGIAGRLVVGVDVDARQLLGTLADVPASGQRGATQVLLDGNGDIVAGGGGLAADFHTGPDPIGRTLPAAPNSPLRNTLDAVLRDGVERSVTATVGGHDDLVVTAPLAGVHWVLASMVPKGGLLPDQTALTRGIDTGVHQILVVAIPVMVVLLLLSFLLASLLARRLVGPVRDLTRAAEHLGAGRTDIPVPRGGDDEVGLLATAMEGMRVEINASRDAILAAARELEGRVTARTAELRARNDELVALNDLAGSLTRSLDPLDLLSGALETLRVLVPLRHGRGYVAESGHLRLVAETEPPAIPAHDDGLAGVARAAMQAGDLALRAASDGVLLAIPLATGGTVQGVAAVVARTGWHLDARTRRLLRAVGDQVGLALHTAALSAEGRDLAVFEERTRLAREIHDTIAQQLTGIVLQLEAAEALVPRDVARALRTVVEARDQARSALAEARRSVWDLRPGTLEATGLAGAVQAEVRRLRSGGGPEVRLREEGLPRALELEPSVEVAIFRIIQEALANARRHGGARSIEVELRVDAGALEVSVTDDGKGFDEHSVADGHFGIVGMRERARLIGAELDVTTSAGVGTCVHVRVRLPVMAAMA